MEKIMAKLTRRQFGKLAGLGSLGLMTGCTTSSLVFRKKPRVVVVGGGFGGATAAKYLRMMDRDMEVTLVEPNSTYYTCPFSNLVVGGVKGMTDIAHDYKTLQSKYGVNFVRAKAYQVKSNAVILEDGSKIPFDRAIVSPGIDVRYDKMPGHSQGIEKKITHSWKAGPQTMQLRRQLEAMANGGTVIICPPGNPYRCPPGPYERASMIAHYLKNNKPNSKIIILDQKEKFSKQPLFTDGWDMHYGDLIEWRSATAGGKVSEIDAEGMRLNTEFGWEEGDVINYIPAQWAGAVARKSGLADDSGWCPVDHVTFESKLVQNVHVIGDACKAGAMPKSGFSANSQGKVAAAAVVSMFWGEDPVSPSFANTCYSYVTPDYSVSVAAVYSLKEGAIAGVEGAGGVSPKDASAIVRKTEATYAQGWYDSITYDMFG
jgi:sulfide dehydrogenase [flavocytochrome c] flavoprotein subunit